MSQEQRAEAVVDRVSELLGKQVGLRPEPTLRGRLRRCIRDEAASYGQDLNAYLTTVTSSQDAQQSLLNRVTVQETAFFRHSEHFQVLAREVLPGLPRPVKIWSAACANGQEAFSLAMLLEEMRIDGSVIATDLSTAAIRRTAAARYTAREVTGLSPERVARHLTYDGPGWMINKNLRDRVTTMRHNLIDPIPDAVLGSQVVFCRNVLIYFSAAHAKAFLDQLAERLPQATVFLGSAETIWSISDRYAAIRVDDTFIYRPRTHARSVVPQNSPAAGSGPRRVESAPRAALRAPAVRVGKEPSDTVENDADAAVRLAAAGERASAAGDHQSAVIAFRKCAYLVPDDAVAHLHLGLSLESSGDNPSAQRAFSAARTLVNADPQHLRYAIGGYTAAELLRLLDTKTKPEVAP